MPEMNWCCAPWQPATQGCLSTRQGCTQTSINPRLQQPCSCELRLRGGPWSLPQTDSEKHCCCQLVVNCHLPRSDWHVTCPLPLPLKTVPCLIVFCIFCQWSLISLWCQPSLIIRCWPLIRGKHPWNTMRNSCTRSAAICFHFSIHWISFQVIT